MNKLQKWIAGNLLGLKAQSPPAGTMSPTTGYGRFVEINGTVTWISDKLSSYITEGYEANDIVYSAVMMIMDKVRCAPWGLYKVNDESSLKRYQGIIANKFDAKGFVEAMNYRKKALEPITTMNSRLGKLNDLMKWPNEYCTWQDQVAEGAGWKMLVGNEMLWANILNAGANQGVPQELIHAPAQFMNLIVKRGFPERVVGYQLTSGEIRRFTTEEILHSKFWNPNYNANGTSLLGMAPLKSAARTLKRNNSNKKAGSVQFDNNGAAGIVYVDDALVPPAGREAQRDVVKKAWSKEYAGAEHFGKVAFSGYKMGFASVGMSLKDMDSSAIENIDLRRLFNIWGLPSQLGNDPDNKTFNNQKEAEKALTSRCALPQLVSKRDRFNRKLQTDWGFGGVNVYVDFDMSVYSELQEDQGAKWEWVKQLPVPEVYKLELMGLDIPDELPADLILVDNNKVPLADLLGGLTADEQQAINDQLAKAGLPEYLRIAK